MLFSEWFTQVMQGFQYLSSLPVLPLFTGGTFYEYLIQHSLESGGIKVHFRWVKAPGTAPY